MLDVIIVASAVAAAGTFLFLRLGKCVRLRCGKCPSRSECSKAKMDDILKES